MLPKCKMAATDHLDNVLLAQKGKHLVIHIPHDIIRECASDNYFQGFTEI